MPYPNDPDVMRGDKERYYVTAPQQGRKGPYTQSDAIRVATAWSARYRQAANAQGAKAQQYEREGKATHARNARSREADLRKPAAAVTIVKA
jgi:hypothetical protein